MIVIFYMVASIVAHGSVGLVAQNNENFLLQVLHINDFHARFEETSIDTPICVTNDDRCLGGFPRLYHEIMALKEEMPDALLLNAGDSFQGTFWYTLFKWNITQEFMNLLPHDAHAIGNHDFDDGIEGLANYLTALKAPVLAANMDSSNEPILQNLYKSHVIIEKKGRKIGIIGLITTDTGLFSHSGNVKFLEPKSVMKRELKMLIQQGVNIIIVLSHCGHDMDKELAHEFGEYVDIVVGGHSHRAEVEPRPYPVFVESIHDKNHKVLVVQTSAFTKYIGNLSVHFDSQGNYVNWEGGMIYLNRSIPEDAEIKTKLAPYAKLVHEAQKKPIGHSMNALKYEECSRGECALGNLITDAYNELAKQKIKSDKYPFLAFAQRNYLTATIPNGIITHGKVIELLPYYDQIETFRMMGKYVLEVLERGASEAFSTNPFSGPLLLQVSGLKVTYNVSKNEGERVTSVLVGDENEPLNLNKYYQITAPGFLADGGDGYTMFRDYKKDMYVIGHDQNVVIDYIQNHSPLNIELEGRITINV